MSYRRLFHKFRRAIQGQVRHQGSDRMMQGEQDEVSAVRAVLHWAVGLHGILTAAIAGFLVALLALWRRGEVDTQTRRRERELREELQGYAQLDGSLGGAGRGAEARGSLRRG